MMYDLTNVVATAPESTAAIAVAVPVATQVPTTGAETTLGSLFDLVLAGGPMMFPLGLCSVIALAYAAERSLRLSERKLGSKRFVRDTLNVARSGGADEALSFCEKRSNALSRVLLTGLRRRDLPLLEVEKAVEDAGAREVRKMSANLRPLVVVAVLAPLLGLLGTVWGMIQAFAQLAAEESAASRPELLAAGVSQALVTTAAGLAIAIPAQALYYYFRGRIDRFIRRSEEGYVELDDILREGTLGDAA